MVYGIFNMLKAGSPWRDVRLRQAVKDIGARRPIGARSPAKSKLTIRDWMAGWRLLCKLDPLATRH